ncbi:MAG TPA: LysM peptidoglycan-binding domain-containing protein [Opitutaceae bacterium]|nr:LysM peptidoglycan-binding domain-containing protein [Opitutaceae bacterium]
MSSSARLASSALLLIALLSPLAAQTPMPAAPAEKSAVADLESKLSIALRSYSLLDAELDRQRAANAKLVSEKAALEARLAESQAAVPLAAQSVTLREQLRQSQAQMAAYAEENVQLKTKLALVTPESATAQVARANPAPAAAAPTPAPAAQRTHVIVEGDTLVKISQTYYGTPGRWSEILAANREALRDEKSLVIGRTLIVP